MPNSLLWSLVVVACLTLIMLNIALGPCKCGRTRKWYFGEKHERSPSLLYGFILQVAGTILTVIFVDYGAIVYGLAAVWAWRRYWFHEKDKIKRAAKALGRVVIKDNGRLAVE